MPRGWTGNSSSGTTWRGDGWIGSLACSPQAAMDVRCIASAGHPSETRRLHAPLPPGDHDVPVLLPGFHRKCVWQRFGHGLPVAQLEAAAQGQIAQAWIGQHQSSEEHTSELQSLMRLSYADCCLK